MPIRRKTLHLGMTFAVIIGFAGGNSFAQSTGPAALAARQHIKSNVLSALEDGRISPTERYDILTEAREILNPQEYAGLVRTIKRFSPSKSSAPPGSPPELAMPNSIAADHPVARRFLSEVPYLEESQFQMPRVRDMLPRLSYVKPPEMSVAAEADRIVARLPRLYDIYLEPPSWIKESENQLAVNKPKSLPPSKAKSQIRIAASEKQVKQKKSGQDLKKNALTSTQVTIQEPATLWSKAERPIISRPSADYSAPVLTTPAAVLLSDRESAAVNVIFDEPMDPKPESRLIRP